MPNAHFQFASSQASKTLGCLLAILLAAVPVAAEELVLKNGQKIVGTIVGFENDMFRVETEYGFALVRKDKVETVNFPKGDKGEAAKKSKKTAKAAENSPAAGVATPATATAPIEAPPLAAPMPPASAPAARETVHKDPPPPAPKPVKAAIPPPPPPSRPVDEPLPANLQEHAEGTTYVNDSFHFAMFKPPGWKVFAEVPKETGSAIMAIGTEDEQTLLFVDRQVWSGTPDYKSDSPEAKIRATYQEYHKLNESPTEVGGQPALRRAFKGLIDGAEWHGLSVHLAHGNAVFGIIGLTSAETYQFQQAIFSKIISSFHFLPEGSTAAPASKP